MRLAVVYNPNDPKLAPAAYSWTYRDMLLAVFERFAPVVHVTESCDASAIEADAILFYDVHSSHEIEIAGIEKHPALKIEYFNDPHQAEQRGVTRTGHAFHKLSAQQRCERAKRRGVQHIICPYRYGWHRYLEGYAGDMGHWWFPVAPANRRTLVPILSDRRPEILGNGHEWPGEGDFKPYEFRRWAFAQPGVTHVPHALDGGAASGPAYQAYLCGFAGALALCDAYVVPKYIEIPLAGCVCFCQMLPEYAEMGFADGVNCIAVTGGDFRDKVRDFLARPGRYQGIADAGRELALQYTADRFAERLWNELTTE